MVVSMDNVRLGVCSYVDKEIVCKMNGLGKWVLGASMVKMPDIITTKYMDFKPTLMSMGIASDDDHIDIDKAELMLIEVANKYGKVTQSILGTPVTFNADDIACICRHIKSV